MAVDPQAMPSQTKLFTTRGKPQTPSYEEIVSSDELRNAQNLFQKLANKDWSFAEENTQYMGHDIHPYPAKFIPQIPGTLVSLLSLRGELVFDPFGGSGTTALEAICLGRRAMSVDINPLAALIGRVKTHRLTDSELDDVRSVQSAAASCLSQVKTDGTAFLDEYSDFIPSIPNIDKWFSTTSRRELAFLRAHIQRVDSEAAKNVCLVALSRVVLPASFQDSETRYASKPREIDPGFTLEKFLHTLNDTCDTVCNYASEIQHGIAKFETVDSRAYGEEIVPSASVDLIVTSPPYGNATDYHLYHRFRLFWLGFDPVAMSKVEIGSHLRHQKENTGFEEYLSEMVVSLQQCVRTLKPGRYAALVIGDPVYNGQQYDAASALSGKAQEVGFDHIGTIERDIHDTKRSFIAAARRATHEKILLLRKPPNSCSVHLVPPQYNMWDYERLLRKRETEIVVGAAKESGDDLVVESDCYRVSDCRKLAFTSTVRAKGWAENTWQRLLENGLTKPDSSRKEPKYVTHGIHKYKGKFYPQLAKALINLSGLQDGAKLLDPFCGSGTAVLEGYLNGMRAYGCDMHPLAAKISRAKVGILDIDPQLVEQATTLLEQKLSSAPRTYPEKTDELTEGSCEEAFDWFPEPVVYKLNWLLKRIRTISTGILQDYFEVIVSSLIREVSQQHPRDLRIRRRKEPIEDAKVIEIFWERLKEQVAELRAFWNVRGYCPHRFLPAQVICGNACKSDTYSAMGLNEESVDLMLTSPPYATALPYIDTDRLSLLVLFGMSSSQRRPLEHKLTGSREIRKSSRKSLDADIEGEAIEILPEKVIKFLKKLYELTLRCDVGFRRRNKPALLLRFFRNMQTAMEQSWNCLKPGSQAFLIVGDSRTKLDGEWQGIPTTKLLESICRHIGFETIDRIDIEVTTDNHKHAKNAITDNIILQLKKPL